MSEKENTEVSGQKSSKKRRITYRPGRNFLFIVILVVAIGAAVFYYNKYQDAQKKLDNPSAVAKLQTQQLISQVGELAQLPTGESPTVATVSDVSKLSGQTFFANAQNGDKVLIYTKSKKAYLYRPSTNKIINVAPLNVNNPQ